jgi:acyl-CoA synthetase (AMP-forming)/AMP-acid ligase II
MPATLRSSWRHTVRANPAAPALLDAATGRTWTRAELTALGAEWAAEFGAGLAGQRVVFAETNGPGWFRVFLGLLAADAVIVALDPGEPLAAQRTLAENLGALALWHDNFLEPVGPPRRKRARGTRLLKLTSGTTGLPRALPFTDGQLLADGRQVCATMGIKRRDVNLGCIPFGHSYGLGNLVLPLLMQGTAILCGVPLLPQALGEAMGRWRPTVFPAVPALLRALAASELPAGQLCSLRTVISAGAPLAPEVAQAFHEKFGRKIHNFYGSSETGGIAYDRTGNAALTGASVGRPLQGVTLRFGAGGRFWVKSRAVGGRGVFQPADRGELNARGELVLLGRAGRMVKIGGRRLDPAEVERALRQISGVEDALSEPHRERADTLVAVVATRRTAEELRAGLQERIAGWKIPRKFVIVTEFPLTARGKADMRRVRALLHGD